MLQQRMLHFTCFACLCKRWTLFLWYSQTYSTHSILNNQKYVFSSWPSWKFKSLKSLHCHYQNFLFFQKPIFSKMIQLFGCIITFHQPPILEILCHFEKWAKKKQSKTSSPQSFWGRISTPKKPSTKKRPQLWTLKPWCVDRPTQQPSSQGSASLPVRPVWVQWSKRGRKQQKLTHGLMGWVSSVLFQHRCFFSSTCSPEENAKNKIMIDGKDRSLVVQKAFWSKDGNSDLYFTHL